MSQTGPYYVWVEGLDGSGKSTLCQALKAHYGELCDLRCEPTKGTTTGEICRTALKVNPDIFATFEDKDLWRSVLLRCFQLDRVAHNEEVSSYWTTWASQGCTEAVIVQDRSILSTAVYQTASSNEATELLIESLPKLLRPTHIVYLDLPPTEARMRLAMRGQAIEPLERMHSLTMAPARYNDVLAVLPTLLPKTQILRLDATQSIDKNLDIMRKALPGLP